MNFVVGRLVEQNGGIAFSTSRMALQIPKKNETPTLKKYIGSELIGAIRPEYISLKATKEDARASNSFYASVDITELVGADRYVHLNIGQKTGESYIARVPSKERYTTGQEVTVYADMDYFLFFDLNTENRIM